MESIPILEKAYLSVAENAEANTLFQTASDSLLHPNNILFDEATAKIVKTIKIHPYTLNIVLCISCLESLSKIYEEARLKEKPLYREICCNLSCKAMLWVRVMASFFVTKMGL